MKRSIKTLQLISLVIVVGFGISCLSDTDAGVDLSMVPDGFTWEGKEDLFGGSCDEFHQASADITVLSAQLIGRAAPSSNTVPADYNVDCDWCDVLRSEEAESYDCQFYDECLDMTLDCTSQLERMTGLPFLTTAVFDNVRYVSTTYEEDAPTEHAGETVSRYYAESFNCNILEIVTVSRSDALPWADGIGFYYSGQVAYFPIENMYPIGEVTLANGEPGTLHSFGALSLCWAGSMSSSSATVNEFKPFLLFGDESACYFNWDAVPENYRISVHTRSFDRSGELLR